MRVEPPTEQNPDARDPESLAGTSQPGPSISHQAGDRTGLGTSQRSRSPGGRHHPTMGPIVSTVGRGGREPGRRAHRPMAGMEKDGCVRWGVLCQMYITIYRYALFSCMFIGMDSPD